MLLHLLSLAFNPCCHYSSCCLSLLPDHAQTTLVRYILNERHGFRIAVILNEYGGETGLESAFVQDEQVRPRSSACFGLLLCAA
jgi:hypothetical protein